MSIDTNTITLAMICAVFVVVLFLMFGAFLYYRRERTLTHTERMKALELGQPLPDDPETAKIKAKTARTTSLINSVDGLDQEKSLAYQCYATTSYIAGAGFFFAFVSGGSVAYALAAAAGAVGVTGMICGTVLATREVRSEPIGGIVKPRFDPEAV